MNTFTPINQLIMPKVAADDTAPTKSTTLDKPDKSFESLLKKTSDEIRAKDFESYDLPDRHTDSAKSSNDNKKEQNTDSNIPEQPVGDIQIQAQVLDDPKLLVPTESTEKLIVSTTEIVEGQLDIKIADTGDMTLQTGTDAPQQQGDIVPDAVSGIQEDLSGVQTELGVTQTEGNTAAVNSQPATETPVEPTNTAVPQPVNSNPVTTESTVPQEQVIENSTVQNTDAIKIEQPATQQQNTTEVPPEAVKTNVDQSLDQQKPDKENKQNNAATVELPDKARPDNPVSEIMRGPKDEFPPVKPLFDKPDGSTDQGLTSAKVTLPEPASRVNPASVKDQSLAIETSEISVKPDSLQVDQANNIESPRPVQVSTASSKLADQVNTAMQNMEVTAGKQIVIRLSPVELGSITIKFVEHQGQLTGVLEVERPQTRFDLEKALPELARSLQESGIQVRRLEVTQSDQLQQQAYRDSSGTQQQQAYLSDKQQSSNGQQESSKNEASTGESSTRVKYPGSEESVFTLTDKSINMLI